MQITSSGYAGVQAAPYQQINHGVMISFMRTVASGIKFFTIGQSRIQGRDIIKGGGSTVSFFDKYQLTDYTARTKSWSVSRRLGQFPYGTIMAQADVELDNNDNMFLPNYDNVIGSGTGQPYRPIKISAGIGLDSFKQFTGFTTQPDSSLSERTTTLHAYDVFDFMNHYDITASGVHIDKYFHEIVEEELEAAGFAASQFVLDKSLQQKIGFLPTNGLKLGDLIKRGCEAEQGLAFVDENGIIRFWNRQHMTTVSGTNLPHQLSYNNVRDIRWQNTPAINHVIVRAKPRALMAKQLIWQLETPIEVLPGTEKSYFCDFVDDNGVMPVTSVDIPAYAGVSSSFTTNLASDASGDTASDSIRLSYAYLFGNQYLVKFINSNTSSVYITSLNLYGTPVKVTNIIEETYLDAPSIDQQGRNPTNGGEPLVIENDLIQDRSTAYSLAYTLVKEYKDPRKRLVCPVFANPAAQIGDPVTVYINETNQTVQTHIVGMETKMSDNANLEQEWELEERSIKQYFTIGLSRIQGSHSIAP